MPTMQLVNDDVLNVHVIYSYMAHPSNEQHRQEYMAAILAHGLFEADRIEEKSDRVDSGHLRWLLKSLFQAPPANEIVERAENSRGFMAGEVLCYVAQLKLMGHPASINKAVAMLSQEYSETTDGKGEKLVTREKTILKAWAEYKPASHLWAALRTRTQNGFEIGKALFEHHDIKRFLSVAESYRQFGIGHCSHSRDKPLLESNETWMVPASYELAPLSLAINPDDSIEKTVKSFVLRDYPARLLPD